MPRSRTTVLHWQRGILSGVFTKPAMSNDGAVPSALREMNSCTASGTLRQMPSELSRTVAL